LGTTLYTGGSENDSKPITGSETLVALSPAQIASARLSEPSGPYLESADPGPRILLLDIENSPALAWVWGLFNEDINLQRLVTPKEMLCFAAKWLGDSETVWYSKQNKDNMLLELHKLLDEADVVIHYNGDRHDMPIINAEFLKAGFPPPSPYKNLDLYKTIRKTFRFTSGKMEHVLKELGLKEKLADGGFATWVGCIENDLEAWASMRIYNIGDVDSLEEMYFRVRPWIQNHPSHSAYTQTHCCPNCGSHFLVKRGYAYTKVSKFQQWRCNDCGKWSRTSTKISGVRLTEVV
jgi:hypothetical protein